jgi:hypothetical protein
MIKKTQPDKPFGNLVCFIMAFKTYPAFFSEEQGYVLLKDVDYLIRQPHRWSIIIFRRSGTAL